MEQSLFDFPVYKIPQEKGIRLIELFAGVGSQYMSLKNLKKKGIIKQNLESWKVVEFDKYAVASFNAIHGTSYKPTDIREIHAADLDIRERESHEYILTYSFPCTDISIAGKMKGYSKQDHQDGKSTRSGLLWEVERILDECGDNLPQILLMENVTQVHSDANEYPWNQWIKYLESKGYVNAYRDLNSKDFGMAQNRDRCYMISILSDEYVDYNFPTPRKLDKTVRDYLETKVDEKYYIKNDKALKLIKDLESRDLEPQRERESCLINQKGEHLEKYSDIAVTLTAREYKGFGGFQCSNGVIEKLNEKKNLR